NFLLYRGFDPPRDPSFVTRPGTVERIGVPSPALGRRVHEACVYVSLVYAHPPRRRYPVLYLLPGFPGRPLAFLETVQMGVVEDSLVSRGRAQPPGPLEPLGSDRP